MTLRFASGFLIPFLICIMGPLFLSAESVTLNPSQDNTMFSENNNTDGKGAHLFAGQNRQGDNRRTLLQFDILGHLPAGAVIESVALQLTLNKTPSGASSKTGSLHRLTRAWGEGSTDASGAEGRGSSPSADSATWNFAQYNTVSWTSSGGDYTAGASAMASVGVATSTVTWNSSALAADVQGWLDGDFDNNGWILIVDGSGVSAKRFSSRENSATSQRPQLSIVYTLPVKQEQTITFNNPGEQILEAGHLNLMASASSGLPVSYSVESGPAILDGSSVQFTDAGTIVIRASQPGNENFQSALDVTQSFVVVASWDSWRQTVFSPAELSDPELSGEMGDVDGDGRINLVEYALGSDPGSHDGTWTGDVSFTEGVLSWLGQYNEQAYDVQVYIQQSQDLVNWTDLAVSINGKPFTIGNGALAIVENGENSIVGYDAALTSEQGQHFIRLHIMR